MLCRPFRPTTPSNSTFSIGPTGETPSTTSNGLSSASSAHATYVEHLTLMPPWIKGPPNGPWRPSLKHHGPHASPAQSSSSASRQASSFSAFGPGTTLLPISVQPPYSYATNGSSTILGAGTQSLSSTDMYETPHLTSTGLHATSAQILGSGDDISLTAGQTIVMITLAHDSHGPRSTSLLIETATAAASSLAFSSADVSLASGTATVNASP